MASERDVSDFWGHGNTLERILEALKKAGLSTESLSVQDLAPVDHLHARGLPATVDLADRLPIARDQHILDIGCAVGGPARYMAERFGCRVSGIDITPGFIEAGEALSRLTGMTEMVDLRVGDGATLPYESSTFDGAYTQHVTMNVPDRAAFYAEAFRVLKPGGFFALQAVDTSWMWSVQDGEVRYSLTGWWYLLISGPMFQVILFRWFWRFLIWAAFLFRVSRLSLALQPTDPDLAGGLGYLGIAQQTFTVVFFAFATVASSTIAHDILVEGGTFDDAKSEIIVLVLAFVVVIYAPLLFFSKLLFLARRAGLTEYGSLGYRLSEAFQKKWIREGDKGVGKELLASTDPSAIADYTATYDNVRAMRSIPATLRGVLTVAAVLLVPFLPLALTEFSLQDLLNRLIDALV